jgi:hypothetical protein
MFAQRKRMRPTSCYRFFAAQARGDALGLFDELPINTVHGAGLHFQYQLLAVLSAYTLFFLSKNLKKAVKKSLNQTNQSH